MPPYWVLQEYEALQSATPEGEAWPVSSRKPERKSRIDSESCSRRTFVRFGDDDKVHVIPGRHELSSHEFRNSWYSPADLARIGSSNELTVKFLLFYGDVDENVHCLRGLEHKLGREQQMRDRVRINSIYAVLMEQSRQKREKRKPSVELLSKAYTKYTLTCSEEARARALQDERNADAFVSAELSGLKPEDFFGHYLNPTSLVPVHKSYDDEDLLFLKNMMKDVVLEEEKAPRASPKPDTDDDLQYLQDLMFDGGVAPLHDSSVYNSSRGTGQRTASSARKRRAHRRRNRRSTIS